MVTDVDAVLLDVGGVFLLPQPEVMLPSLRAVGVVPDLPTLDRAHYAAVAAMDRAAEDGAVGDQQRIWVAYRQAYAAACGVPGPLVAEVAESLRRSFSANSWNRVVPGSVAALRRLADDGHALGIVSNAAGTIAEMLIAGRVCQVGAGEGVPVIVVVDSHVVGVEKPDAAIFGIALDRLGVEPARAVYVGDTCHYDVAGARAAGLRPLHLDPYGDCPKRQEHDHVRDLDEVRVLLSRGRSSS
jgi:putative hydrolase of the HAD superfamily